MIEVYLAGVAFALGMNVSVWLLDGEEQWWVERVVCYLITSAFSWFWVGLVVGAGIVP